MTRAITQRELRDGIDEACFVSADSVMAMFCNAPAIDGERFRADLDSALREAAGFGGVELGTGEQGVHGEPVFGEDGAAVGAAVDDADHVPDQCP